MPIARLQTLVHSCALIAVLSGSVHAGTTQPTVSVTVTEHGIPHIVAPDYRSLGFGYGYTMAENDLCGMASMFATYSGERALRFGEEGSDINYLLGRRALTNPASDFTMRLMIDDAHVRRANRSSSPQIRELLRGYAQGFNSYLATATTRPAACRDGQAVRPITPDDVQRRVKGLAMLLSSGLVLQEIYDAAPPTDALAQAAPAIPAVEADAQPSLAGSNAYAFGKDTTDNGSGLLLGNPHFFWDGPNRFIELHLTIPGEYDAMGVALQGLPLVVLGFNRSLAWTHTVSTDKRGALYRLSLDPGNPTRYLLDGRSIAMTRKHVTIRARTAAGKIVRRTHVFWMTRFGPVLASASMPWTRQHAYALADANQANDRMLQQWLEIAQSSDVRELKAALERRLGLPWVNTIAADRDGNAFYADLSVAPNFDAATLRGCAIAALGGLGNFFAVVDGSRTACAATVDPAAAHPGLLPAQARPSMVRTDFVANSNGSHWLTNAAAPLEGFSPVIGPERTAQSLRARQNQIQVSERLAGTDGLPGKRMSQEALERILFSGRSLQAELVLDDLLGACKRAVATGDDAAERGRLQRGCVALSKWNRRYDLDSVGAHVFTEFVNQARQPGSEDLGTTAGVWRIAFDPADPVHTPRALDTDNPALLKALGDAVARLDEAKIPLEARLGDVQFVVRDNVRIPLHGGATFSALHATLVPGIGYTDPIGASNSYIQVVTFDAAGPVADAILASSQTPEAGSAFHADQTLAYSRKQWLRLPFTPKAIAAAAIGPTRILRVPAR